MKQQPLSDNIKNTAVGISVQASHMGPAPNIDPNLQSIMDSLQLSDSNVYRIIRGEIHELMDKHSQILVLLSQTIEELRAKTDLLDNKELQVQFAKILNIIEKVDTNTASIETELQHYYKMVPYLLMLSQLMWLSNLSSKAVRDIQFKESIMVQRDKCLRDDDCDEGFDDDNFYDSIEILMHVIVAGSERGWKSNVIRNEVKEVKTTIEDHTTQGKERKGILGKLLP